MIYLLQSSGYDSEDAHIDLLKIGYTTDSTTLDKRIKSYYTHNPTIKLLFVISSGEESDERNLHKYFERFKFNLSDSFVSEEWFYYRKEIIEFFSLHEEDNMFELRESIPEFPKEKANLSDKTLNIRILADSITRLVYNGDVFKEDSIVKELRGKNFKNLIAALSYVRELYGELTDNIIDLYEDIYYYLNSEEVSDIKKNLKKHKSWERKLLEICKLPEELMPYLLDLVPMCAKKAYVILGIEKCWSLGFDLDRINREYNIIFFDKDLLKSKIYEEFSVGNVILKSELKQRLAKIYIDVGYRAAPKAVNIRNWFEIARATIPVNGVHKGAFKLLRKLY